MQRPRENAAVNECGKIGRDPAEIARAFWAIWPEDANPIDFEGRRYIFTGGAAEIAGDIATFRDMGVRHLLFNFQRATLDEMLESMERCAKEVLPLVN